MERKKTTKTTNPKLSGDNWLSLRKNIILNKIIYGVIFAFVSFPSYSQDFYKICKSNGESYLNVVIDSFIIMGAENDRKLYISFYDQYGTHYDAQKNYDGNSYKSDLNLISTTRMAYFTGQVVDLCVPSNTRELYGINLKG